MAFWSTCMLPTLPNPSIHTFPSLGCVSFLWLGQLHLSTLRPLLHLQLCFWKFSKANGFHQGSFFLLFFLKLELYIKTGGPFVVGHKFYIVSNRVCWEKLRSYRASPFSFTSPPGTGAPYSHHEQKKFSKGGKIMNHSVALGKSLGLLGLGIWEEKTLLWDGIWGSRKPGSAIEMTVWSI